MNKTNIQWCDYTWNPIVGCSPASDGCTNCYAATFSKRFHLPWGAAYFIPNRLAQPDDIWPFSGINGWRRDQAIRERQDKGWPEVELESPWKVFVCSMSDLGHETVQPEWRSLVLRAMHKAPEHTYIILTKRPGEWLRMFAPFAWLGVTVERRARVCERWQALCTFGSQSPVLSVSVEPMLESVSFRGWTRRPDWTIAGPETGPKARPCEDAWIDELAAESPCFFDKRKKWKRREFPKHE